MIGDYCIFEKRIWKIVNDNDAIANLEAVDGHKPRYMMVPYSALIPTAKDSMLSRNIVRG